MAQVTAWVVTLGLIVALFATLPAIHRWEREAGYPYGKMCNSVFTLYVDTCPK